MPELPHDSPKGPQWQEMHRVIVQAGTGVHHHRCHNGRILSDPVPRHQGSFSFVHAADLHLDTPFLGVRASAPFVADALREASLDAFDAIIDLAIERGVDFVLFAGDIYDGPERGIRAQLRFLNGLRRLDEVGINSFVVHGNHDPLESGWSAVIEGWPERAVIFTTRPDGNGRVAEVEVVRDDVVVATVQGVSYKERATTENLSKLLTRPEVPGVHIGVLHCNVEGSPGGHANYSPCTIADLRATGLDYLALGHVHDRRILNAGTLHGEPWIVYPGNSQARTINETGAKGAYVVRVTNGSIDEPEFVACDIIRFVRTELAIDGCETVVDLAELAAESATALLGENDGRSIIVRATLTGQSPLHRQLARKGELEELLGEVRLQSAHHPPFCWWDQIVDESTEPMDLGAIRARGDFSTDLLALAEGLDSDGRAELIEELVESVPKSLRKDLARLVADESWTDELIKTAQMRALDEIVSGE